MEKENEVIINEEVKTEECELSEEQLQQVAGGLAKDPNGRFSPVEVLVD
ncbi:MAG: bacteriocin [Erysipelotrichaceae bacterium]|nr:bacteriocin [Erysipelotrichaceae bacterium]